jgi:carbonic anhydrase/acetyltransferase-like protein (isoleucine patch superfamily)
MDTIITDIDERRREQGLLDIEQMLKLIQFGITVHDPFSTLISIAAKLASGTIIYPNCMILCGEQGSVSLAQNNVLNPSTILNAEAGSINIGSNNTFGPGGFTATAMAPAETVIIGNHGRYNNGASVYGNSTLGDGSQILGQISVDSCSLGAGDSFKGPNPDKRGAVLKGFGRAKNLNLETGDVIQAFGMFEQDKIERQTIYHPREAS